MTPREIGGIGALVVTVVGLTLAYINDRRQRELLARGDCAKVTEALYTPPPVARTSCSGQDGSHSCTTWYQQADPYMRSLWRCTDPAEGGKASEFWRRTAEEHGR